MNTNIFYTEIVSYCKANENQVNIKKYSRYFKEGYDAYGLSQTQINDKVKEILKNKEFTLNIAFEIAPKLMKSGKYEETSFVLLLINQFHKQYTTETLDKISDLYKIGITNWAHADTLGMFMLPEFLLKGIVPTDYFNSWIKSEYKFQRRSVPVTFIKYIKKTRDFKPLITIVKPLMLDEEREVNQGMGWFLREAWKITPEEVESFMLPYKDKSARLIFQYACEKMTPEAKQKFKKTKNPSL